MKSVLELGIKILVKKSHLEIAKIALGSFLNLKRCAHKIACPSNSSFYTFHETILFKYRSAADGHVGHFQIATFVSDCVVSGFSLEGRSAGVEGMQGYLDMQSLHTVVDQPLY